MAGLDFDRETKTKLLFTIPPNPKIRTKRINYEINNIVLRAESNILKKS
jgi:hypothetical protein